ncbi:hypothetical protein [Burkholderia sp. lig30]|jgi:hypothetical protein|uniref:hypothetical protein n=1 Tax=Burkholderia sp. lig30 TaxID=1192124 RepID=UPI00128EE5FE|nr:hypothetical protein [Burkholderia sp. lig30]
MHVVSRAWAASGFSPVAHRIEALPEWFPVWGEEEKMEIRWERLYSGGLGEYYESPAASRRAMRRAKAMRALAAIACTSVAMLVVAAVVFHWPG